MRVPEYIRALILAAGVGSSWSALIVQFTDFYRAYGTLWHMSTGIATNPLLTPCLYGSLAFLAAFVWSCVLLFRPNPRADIWLNRLLLFGVAFAAVVVAYDCADYLHLFIVGIPIVCTPNVNPLLTPCFRGLIFFAAAYAAGLWVIRTNRRPTTVIS
jgi:hypothetical protein